MSFFPVKTLGRNITFSTEGEIGKVISDSLVNLS